MSSTNRKNLSLNFEIAARCNRCRELPSIIGVGASSSNSDSWFASCRCGVRVESGISEHEVIANWNIRVEGC